MRYWTEIKHNQSLISALVQIHAMILAPKLSSMKIRMTNAYVPMLNSLFVKT
jgi:hypothetical protein